MKPAIVVLSIAGYLAFAVAVGKFLKQNSDRYPVCAP